MYDYIIVGGGSAGCTLAHRLTENEDDEVLLLESGTPEEDRDMVTNPDRVWDVLGSDLNWGFEIEPQESLNGRTMAWPRGKALGGSSAINGMAYVRGHPYDYDNWAELGNEGWSYDEMLPYFKRSEDFSGDGDAAYHGTDGPLSVTDRAEPNEFSDRLLAAAQEAGLERNRDFNGEQQAGVGYYHSTVKDGERHSAAAAFIKPILDRPNLTVETAAHATRIELDGGRATGVTYRQGWDTHEANVAEDGEVVVAAGAIQSPQLLMLSGIGEAAHLEEHGIDVRVDLPGVGRNLQDHLRWSVGYESPEPIEREEESERGKRYDQVLVGAFERSAPDRPAPDMQFGIGIGLTPFQPAAGYSVTVLPLRPTSTGRITLASTDPYDHPEIDPNYLATERDREDVVACVRAAREIGEADELAAFREREVRPGPDVQTDEEILEFVRDTTDTGYHPVGTCKMGDDDMAVVDDDLRVHGLDGLRVVDASVMPEITSGNTNAPTIAIAEKGADLLRNA
ncbi:MAG: GMC family oxidoreductase [Haloarculaceae archaeon]